MRSWNTFGARTSPRLTKIHYGLDLKKPPPSPLEYTLCMAMGPTPKCHFVLRLPSGSPEIPKVGTPATLGVHSFA